MRNSRRITVTVLVLLLVVLSALLAGRNALLGAAAVRALRRATGLEVSFDRLTASLLRSSVRVRGLRIAGPEGFPEDASLEIRELYAVYEPRTLLTRTRRFREVRIDIPELLVVRRADGVTSLERIGTGSGGGFRPVAAPSGGGGKPTPARPVADDIPGLDLLDPVSPPPGALPADTRPAEAAPPPPPRLVPPPPEPSVSIGELTVRIGSLRLRDYTAGGTPADHSFAVGLERTYTDVTDLDKVSRKLGDDLAAVMLPDLLSDLDSLLEEAARDTGALSRQVEEAAEDLGKAVREMFRP